MGRILCLETSTKMCSVAVSTPDGVLAEKRHIEEGFSHAEKLHGLIDQVLTEAQLSYQELDAIAVAKGPGSFTGLRIGVSAAKGLAYAWGLKLISCTSLETLVAGADDAPEVIIPMLDARRMEVYTQTFRSSLPENAISAEIIDADSFAHLHESPVLFCGDGALKCQETLARPDWRFEAAHPEARHMHRAVQSAWEAQRFEDVAYFEPFYLKDFVAGKPKPSPFA